MTAPAEVWCLRCERPSTTTVGGDAYCEAHALALREALRVSHPDAGPSEVLGTAEELWICADYHVPGCPGRAGGDHECRCGATAPDHVERAHPYTDDEHLS